MSGEKTEQPTEKKLRDSEKKGQTAVSKDIQILSKLWAFYIVIFWIGGSFIDQLGTFVDWISSTIEHRKFYWDGALLNESVGILLALLFPLVAACAVAGTVSTLAQIGFIVGSEALIPSFKKFNAIQNIKDMFSKKSLVQLLISICKVVIIALVGYILFKDALHDIIYSYRVGLNQALLVLVNLLKHVIYTALGIFIVLAALDWAMERYQYIENMKMSKHEVKEEYKETQGNPIIKQAIRREQRNLLNSSLNRMSGAKAVVANPTHISVALDYEPGKHDLPFILAMGVDEDAMEMRRYAAKHGIPVIVNVELARMLLRDCAEEEYIKQQHLELAAQVFIAIMKASDPPPSAPVS